MNWSACGFSTSAIYLLASRPEQLCAPQVSGCRRQPEFDNEMVADEPRVSAKQVRVASERLLWHMSVSEEA